MKSYVNPFPRQYLSRTLNLTINTKNMKSNSSVTSTNLLRNTNRRLKTVNETVINRRPLSPGTRLQRPPRDPIRRNNNVLPTRTKRRFNMNRPTNVISNRIRIVPTSTTTLTLTNTVPTSPIPCTLRTPGTLSIRVSRLTERLPLMTSRQRPKLRRNGTVRARSPRRRTSHKTNRTRHPNGHKPNRALPTRISGLHRLHFTRLVQAAGKNQTTIMGHPVTQSPTLRPTVHNTFKRPNVNYYLPRQGSLISPVRRLSSAAQHRAHVLVSIRSKDSTRN